MTTGKVFNGGVFVGGAIGAGTSVHINGDIYSRCRNLVLAGTGAGTRADAARYMCHATVR